MIKNVLLLVFVFVSQLVFAQGLCESAIYLPDTYAQDLESQYFGWDVAIDGDYAVVGAYNYNDKGTAFVYFYDGAKWVVQAQLSTKTASISQFGAAVDISGDNIVIRGGHEFVYLYSKPSGGWVDMTETAILAADDMELNDSFGFDVAISGDVVVVGAPYDNDKGRKSGSIYIFTKPVLGWSGMVNQTAKRTASDGGSHHNFGQSVGISGDNIVVGAPDGNQSSNYYGSAYVFTKPFSGWENVAQSAILSPSNRFFQGLFGGVVSISGDNIVISQKSEDIDGVIRVGAAYVYSKPASGWSNMTETARITSTNGEKYSYFSESVCISGDNIVVSARGSESTTFNGIAFVYTKGVSGWTDMVQTAEIIAIEGDTWDRFGISVAISGDKVLAGDWLNNSKSNRAGAVYSFFKPEGGWVNQNHVQKLEPPTVFIGNVSDSYGKSVAIDGNYAVVGAPGFDQGKGKVYVLENQNTTWSKVATLTADDGVAFDDFGYAVDISGDNIVVGAQNSSVSDSSSGAVYVFSKPTSGWINMTQTAKIYNSDGANNDKFGCSVSISGTTIVAGAKDKDDGGSDGGSAYVFVKPTNGWVNMTQTCKVAPSDPVSLSHFGASVAVDGDNVVVGAYGHSDTGSVYVFTKPVSGWVDMTQSARLLPSDRNWNDNFGISVDIFDETIVVGEDGYISYYDVFGGSAYVFVKPTNGWIDATQNAKLSSTSSNKRDKFGSSVRVSGDSVIVGAFEDYINWSANGSAYLFVKPTGGWKDTTQLLQIKASDGAFSDNFGYAVGIDNGHIIVGADGNDDQGDLSGSAYLYYSCTADLSVSNLGSSLMANESGATYRWLDCNDNKSEVAGETGQTFVPDSDGSFAVEVTLGTNTDTSSCEIITTVGYNKTALNTSINIYPNPSTGSVYIHGVFDKVQVCNLHGQLVFESNNLENYTVVTNLQSGIYLTKIYKNDSLTVTSKIVIVE
jgi:hypothetical protein